MTRKVLGGIIASVVSLIVACAAGVVLLLGGGAASACTMPVPGGAVSVSAPAGGWQRVGRFDPEQVGYVGTIVVVGARKGVSIRGWIIAVATAIQESDLRNLPGGADDSIGLFQQRPSQRWGRPAQLRDPVYAAGKFYEKLLTVTGWQQMPVTEAAQAVQASAYPGAYAEHEPEATLLVNNAGSKLGLPIPSDLERCASTCFFITPADSGSCVETATIFDRAQSWLTAWSGGPVPYMSSGDPSNWFQGYRRDCSGYVSMALGLDGPGLNTSGLAAHSTTIAKADLRPGDLLINTAPDLFGHVVLFDRWADASMTRYYGFEQSGDGGTHHRSIPYPYFGDYSMSPHRFGI